MKSFLFLAIIFTFICGFQAQPYYNVNGTYTTYINQQEEGCVEISENICTPCTSGGQTLYYTVYIIFDIDFPVHYDVYTDSQCTNLYEKYASNALREDCSTTARICAITYQLIEAEFAQLSISSVEPMFVGYITRQDNEIKSIINSKELIANGTIAGLQVYSNDILFRFDSRISETRYNSTLGECNYDEICTSYPFTYSVSIVSRVPVVPTDKLFVYFENAIMMSVSDTDEEYVVNARLSDHIFANLEFVYSKSEAVPTSFPGVTFYAPPKTGDHLQQVSQLELVPQEGGDYYHLKYQVDWYNTYNLVSNCTVRVRHPQYNNDYIICNIPVIHPDLL